MRVVVHRLSLLQSVVLMKASSLSCSPVCNGTTFGVGHVTGGPGKEEQEVTVSLVHGGKVNTFPT